MLKAQGKITAKWIEECLPGNIREGTITMIISKANGLLSDSEEEREEYGDDNDDAKNRA